MCLLIKQPEGTIWTDAFLEGVYKKNGDGLGVMYAENNTLYHAKTVCASFAEYKAFVEQHIQGRACVWHSRMKTHGDIGALNAHPYEVLSGDEHGYPLYLAHNGVLSIGNKADPSRSDTWHYINTFLKPILKDNPALFMEPAFIALVEDHIGYRNKFAMMDAYGNTVLFNESAFVKYNGALLSNTYAWDTTGTEHAPKVYSNFTYGGATSYGSGFRRTEWDDYEDWWGTLGQEDKKETKGAVVVHDFTQKDPEKSATLVVPKDESKTGKLTTGMTVPHDNTGDWVRFFFHTLDVSCLRDAFLQLSFDTVQRYFEAQGEDSFVELIDSISAGCLTSKQIIEEVETFGKKPPLEFISA